MKALCLALLGATLHAQQANLGFAYPAGGQCGSQFQVVLGGQNINGPKAVHLSGEGVSASVVTFLRPVRNLNTEQRWLVADALMTAWMARLAEQGISAEELAERREKMIKAFPWNILKRTDLDLTGAKIPPHPLLLDLESRSLSELLHIRERIFFPVAKLQLNRQLEELVLIAVEIAADAPLGRRELRLQTKNGLSNPIAFQVGDLAEVQELEPNNDTANQAQSRPQVADLIEPVVHDLPVLLNGVIMPGDEDRFRFRGKASKTYVAEVFARRLIPYLADAVPGWFQAVVAVYDSAGNELAYADDHQINPDPRLIFSPPGDGEYEIGIRDAIYRGRDDFIYRIDIREFRKAKEPPAQPPQQKRVELPSVVEGVIREPGQVDAFVISAKAGQTLVAEVTARQDGSPLDSLLRVVDAEGKVVAWNDDHIVKAQHLHLDARGLTTHHADSYLMTTLPAAGNYQIRISDAQNHGSSDHRYRLRLSVARPDFALRVTPSSLHLRPGGRIPIQVFALRKDGFEGAITIAVDAGFQITGGNTIPAGQHSAWMTVVAPAKTSEELCELRVEGIAKIGSREIRHDAVAADQVMQAFLYEHLVPAERLLCVMPPRKWADPVVELVGDDVLRLAPGGRVVVTLKFTLKTPDDINLTLSQGPEGIAVAEKLRKTPEGGEFEFTVPADAELAEFTGNLIIEAFRAPQDGKKPWSIGYLPAIPVIASSPPE